MSLYPWRGWCRKLPGTRDGEGRTGLVLGPPRSEHAARSPCPRLLPSALQRCGGLARLTAPAPQVVCKMHLTIFYVPLISALCNRLGNKTIVSPQPLSDSVCPAPASAGAPTWRGCRAASRRRGRCSARS